MRIDPNKLDPQTTRADIGYYEQVDWSRTQFTKKERRVLSYRLAKWRTIDKTLNTPIYTHWWARYVKYDLSKSTVPRHTVYARIGNWRDIQDAINLPLWAKRWSQSEHTTEKQN